MRHVESYLERAFVVSSIYLLVIILGGFFILPGVFQIGDYSFPLIIELFLKVTSSVASLVVLSSAIIIPALKLIEKPKNLKGSPVVFAAITLIVGLIFIFLNVLYVKLMTCPMKGSEAWHCQVEGKSYVGMLVLTFFLASLLGLSVWVGQKFIKK